MKISKTKIDTLTKCYSIAPLRGADGLRFLVAAEKRDPCYLYDESGKRLETVWTEPGGVMTMVQVPGREDQFLATHEFYSPNDSANARLVLATRRAEGGWEVRTLAAAPFVHRFGVLTRNGKNHLLVCCLKSGHACKDDWSQPGQVFAAELPEDLSPYDEDHPLPLTLLKAQMGHNHGYSQYCDGGVETALVTCDEGVFQFTPPAGDGEAWTIRRLYDQPVSDAVLCDLDGDGEPELGCISPFHGDRLYVCRKNGAGAYEKVWAYPQPCEMLHATWACELLGKPAWLVGYRKGERDLLAVTYEDGGYRTTLIDHDCGPANVMKFTSRDGVDCIVAANRETDEVALYRVTRD